MDFSRFTSITDLVTYFNTESRCREVICEVRWGSDVVCPYCGCHHCHKGYRGRYVCPHCRNKFSVTVGTIFENTKVSLRKWFLAMYLISSHKKGISSCQLSRDIKVTQKTAWYMLMKIRSLYVQDDRVRTGDIELDETYLGGKERFKHRGKKIPGTQGRSVKTKTPVFGVMTRGSKSVGSDIYALKVDQTDRSTLMPIVGRLCAKDAYIYTDEYVAYNPLSRLGYDHSVVFHKAGQFVVGDSYTNNIEGYWTHLKKMILGTYHQVSDKYLQRYLDEECYRWNVRRLGAARRFRSLFGKSIHTMPYKLVTVS